MRMTITLREPASERLRDEAREERRSVRDQAAYLLERQLLATADNKPSAATSERAS